MAKHRAPETETDSVASALRDLLAAIEAEPVPDRVGDLAKALQQALDKRDAKATS